MHALRGLEVQLSLIMKQEQQMAAGKDCINTRLDLFLPDISSSEHI